MKYMTMYDNTWMSIKFLLSEAHTIKPNPLLSMTAVKLLTHEKLTVFTRFSCRYFFKAKSRIKQLLKFKSPWTHAYLTHIESEDIFYALLTDQLNMKP